MEWSPENTFTSINEKKIVFEESVFEIPTKHIEEKSDLSTSIPTIYVKNLNFSTTQEILKTAFINLKGFQSARLSTKPDPKNLNMRLSMGFGFLEFKSTTEAREALKVIQGTMLEGHVLQCKMSSGSLITSQKKRDSIASTENESTKIMIRNIPFEATKKEVRALFM